MDVPATTPISASGPATQHERTQASRQALVDATIAILARDGYRAASIARIQEESGLSRGLVNYHFGSKIKLIEAVVERIRTDYRAQTVGEHGRETMTGRDQVKELFDSYLERTANRPERSRVMLVLATESLSHAPELRSAVQEGYTGLRKTLQEMLVAGVQDGSIRADIDPLGHSAALAALLRGTVLQYFVDPDGLDLPRARAAAIAMLDHDLSG